MGGTKDHGARGLRAVVLGMAVVLTACVGGRSKGPARIPQPQITGIPVAPDSARVDLRTPTFSHPTSITNPLFPVDRTGSTVMLGHVEGKPFRSEVTTLPATRIIEWAGQRVETVVSQYVAFLDGRIVEVAYDHYAQADDGSVWYFGEDVFDFDHGAVISTEGTWLAGRDGPAAMIMPAHPRTGDVYRPENAPPLVFEEVTVRSTGRTLDGAVGAVDGGLVVDELHMDGGHEDKTFGPGYGEFYTAGGGDLEALALSVPTDAASGEEPGSLIVLRRSALEAFDAARSRRFGDAVIAVRRAAAGWENYPAGQVPPRIGSAMDRALDGLRSAAGARGGGTIQAALDVARLAMDLELRYRPAAEVDRERLGLWAAQILAHADAGDAAAVRGDVFALDYVRDRLLGTLGPADLGRVDAGVTDLQVAVGDQDLEAAAAAAGDLRSWVTGAAG